MLTGASQGFAHLWHPLGTLEVERELVHLSSPRCHWKPFEVAPGDSVLRVERVSSIPAPSRQPLTGSLASWGYVYWQGNRLLACIPDEAYAAESVLRLAYLWATLKAGGILVHGCAVAFGNRAVAAMGPSGAGKSTLAQLCSSGAGGGVILTDEMTQLYPQGTCAGTPFRSNDENVGQPGIFRLASVIVLEKGTQEAWTKIPPSEVMNELLSQVYRNDVVPVSTAVAFMRLGQVINTSGVHRLAFRKSPDVGPFLYKRLHGL